MSGNQLENVEILSKLPNLLTLNLSQNLISNLNTFKKETEENDED